MALSERSDYTIDGNHHTRAISLHPKHPTSVTLGGTGVSPVFDRNYDFAYTDSIFGNLTCYVPNCDRTFGRIMTVEISGLRTRFCRIVENFGEDGADSPGLTAVDISAGSDAAPIVSDFRRSVREACYSNRNDRIGRLGVGRRVTFAVAP